MRGDGFQTQKRKSWVSGQVRAERVLADAITIDGRKERIWKFCSETNVWTRWRCRRCGNNIPTGLQGKHKQAVYAKNEGWCSGSSSSSGGEEGKSQDQDEEIEKLRAHVELLRKQQRVGKRPEVQGEPTRRGSDVDEGCRMEIEKGTASLKLLGAQGRICKNSCETSISSPLWSRRLGSPRKRSLCVCCNCSKESGQTFCLSTRRCRRGHSSCKVCTRRSITLGRPVHVKTNCKESVRIWRTCRHVSRLCRRIR